LLRNFRFFKMTRSACYSTCCEHIVSLCRHYNYNWHLYNAVISYQWKLLTSLNKVRFFVEPPTFLGKSAAVIKLPVLIKFLTVYHFAQFVFLYQLKLALCDRFYRCKSLEFVIIERGSLLRIIGSTVFEGCDSLPRIGVVADFTTIQRGWFRGKGLLFLAKVWWILFIRGNTN
jgi:hypothetical protein